MTKLITACLVVLVVAGATSMTFADFLVDRGLPTANLNNVAGADRSNVAWADPPLLEGDKFTLPAALDSYHIDTIRVWVVGKGTFEQMFSDMSLYLNQGPSASGTLESTSSSFVATPVTYADGSAYQATTGSFRNIYQVDFAVDITAPGGTTFNFAVNATMADPTNYPYLFLHASNAALSGSPQDGADNVMSEWNADGSFNNTWDSSGNGWDKSSDINVQVIPEPATMSLLVAGGLALLRRKKH